MVPAALHPGIFIIEVRHLPIGILGLELLEPLQKALVTPLRRDNVGMVAFNEIILHPSQLRLRKSPITAAEIIQIDDTIGGDTPTIVDIGVKIAESKISCAAKNGTAPVQACIARATDCPPAGGSTKDEQNVIEIIY